MGLLDRLKDYLGDDADPRTRGAATGSAIRTARTDDELAVERYRYLLRTASPDEVEEVHAEAFATLTPQQRRLVFDDLAQHASVADRPASDDPRTLARSATRSEMRQPGFLERALGGGVGGGAGGRGPGLGTVIGGSLLGTVAGVVVGSAIADVVLPGIGDLGADVAGGVGETGADAAAGFGDLGGAFGGFGGAFDDLGGDL